MHGFSAILDKWDFWWRFVANLLALIKIDWFSRENDLDNGVFPGLAMRRGS